MKRVEFRNFVIDVEETASGVALTISKRIPQTAEDNCPFVDVNVSYDPDTGFKVTDDADTAQIIGSELKKLDETMKKGRPDSDYPCGKLQGVPDCRENNDCHVCEDVPVEVKKGSRWKPCHPLTGSIAHKPMGPDGRTSR